MTPQPFSLPLNRDNIPMELTRLDQWVTWRYEERATGWTKPPINIYTNTHASTTDKRTWAPYERIAKAARVGFVVTKEDHYSFIDIDNGWDSERRQPKDWAAAVIEHFPVTYWERSPSGNGLKGLVKGKARENRRIVIGDGAVEVWGWAKYTTLTGQLLENAGRQIGACAPGALDALIDELAPPPQAAVPPLVPLPELRHSDETVIAQVSHRSPEAAAMIQRGVWPSSYPSQSEADLGLLDHFVRAGATTPEQLDRLFRATAMMRDKWENEGYRTRTLDKALNGVVRPQLRVVPSQDVPNPTIPHTTYRAEVVYCAHSYPLHIWPPVFRRYIEAMSEEIGAVSDALAVPLLTVLAGVIGNHRTLRVKNRVVKPIIWSLTIGETGTGKTPMFGAAQSLVVPLDVAAGRNFQHEMREWERAQAESRRRGRGGGQAQLPIANEKPRREHFYSSDITIEAVAADLQSSSGLVIMADEALAWFKALNQYKGGKGGDRENWSKLQTGLPIKVNRKTSEPIEVLNPAASFHGGLQPERLPVLADDGFVDGWVGRFLLSLPKMGVLYPNTFEASPLVISDAHQIAARLRLRGDAEPLTYSPSAFDLYFEWATQNSTEAERVDAASKPLKTAFVKLENYLHRIALVLHCVWDPDGREREISAAVVAHAVDLMEYHRSHTEVVYEQLTQLTAPHVSVTLPQRVISAIERLGGSAGKNEIRIALGGKETSDDLGSALVGLQREGRITHHVEPTEGRPRDVYTLVMEM